VDVVRKRHDRFVKVANRFDSPSVHILSMVVVSTVDVDPTAREIAPQLVQHVHAPSSLRNNELRLDLPAESRRSVTEDRNTEAALAVYEPDDPLLVSWPFLLIARTERIVTGTSIMLVAWSDKTGSVGYSGFPAYSQLHSRSRLREGQIWDWRCPRLPTLGWL
jgi:hypothetical protein